MNNARTAAAVLFAALLFSSNAALADEDNTVTLSAALARSKGMPPAQADEQVEKLFGLIRAELKNGHTVEIKDFGRFSVSERHVTPKPPAPGSPAKAVKPPRKFPHFTSAEALKNELNPQKS
ncbi:MAG: HU family DNA-binding protein [Bdellovibrionota bacterium]